MTKKQSKAAQQTSKPTTTNTTTSTPAVAKAPKAIDPQVAKAQAELAAAKAKAKQAEQEAKDQRKAERARLAAERKAAKAEPRPTCTGRKLNGEPCTAKAKNGSGLCIDHQPAWDRMTHEEHVAFGQWLRNAKGPEIVAEIGWFRAKQIAKANGAGQGQETKTATA